MPKFVYVEDGKTFRYLNLDHIVEIKIEPFRSSLVLTQMGEFHWLPKETTLELLDHLDVIGEANL